MTKPFVLQPDGDGFELVVDRHGALYLRVYPDRDDDPADDESVCEEWYWSISTGSDACINTSIPFETAEEAKEDAVERLAELLEDWAEQVRMAK